MARKRFGQNFLIDQGIIDNIIAIINPLPKQHLVEIGPGLGALTRPLLASGAQLDAIEIDRDLIAGLHDLKAKNFTLHNADVLDFDLNKLRPKPLRLIGNLPYNISTPLLFKLFADLAIISDMHFMLQREVALRLVAEPNCKAYGKLTVMAQYYCAIEILLEVPPTAFEPQPQVVSSIVKFTPRVFQPQTDVPMLQQVVGAAFNQRRKTLTNALRGLLTQEDLVQLSINPSLRAENLSLTDYVKLTNYLIGNK